MSTTAGEAADVSAGSQPFVRKLAIVLSVGIPAGVLPQSANGSEAEGHVRLGEQFVAMPASQYLLWCGASTPRSREGLMGWASQQDIADAAATYADLAQRGLVVEMTGRLPQDRWLLERHRAHLLAFGSEPDSTDDRLFGLVSPSGEVRGTVDVRVYEILLSSNTGRSLWEVSEDVAGGSEVSGEDLALALLLSLPTLIASRLLILDAI